MKSRIVASLVSLAAFAAAASPVSLSDADGFVRRWCGSSEDFDGSEIVRTIAVSNGQDVAYYLAIRSSGSAVAISPDTDLYPVLAQAEKVADSDGNVTLEPEHPLWTMLMDGATNSLAKVRKRVLLATSSAKSSPEESDKRTNRARWSAFSGRLTAVYVPPSSDVYGGNEHILAGFESGGALTHWSQTDARKDFRGYAPLYNYYMHEAAPTGLGLDGTYMDYPCGCVATAYAAAAQFHGFTGIVDNGVYQNQLLVSTNMTGATPLYDSKTVSIIPGQYDWSILPSNYGGSAPAVSSYADFPQAAKELIGRVAYNYGIMLNMQYGRSSSGAVVLTPDRKGTLGYGFLDYTKITRDHAHANCPGNLLSGDTAEHIANVIETLVRMNEPAVMSIKSATSGHCVLGVGARGTGTGRYLRVFMGYGGVGDTWFYGGNTVVTSTYTSIAKVCATGGVDHPTTFIHSKFLGCTVSGGSVVFGKVNADAGQNSIVITNADDTIIVAGFCHPYYPESQSGPGTLSGSVTYSMDPFQSGGVTVTPNPETKRVSRSYSFTTSGGARIVSYSGTSFFDTSFGLTATGSKSNGFPYGTPYSLDSFMYTAFTNNVPAVIISGHDGSTSGVVSEFKTGRTASLLNQCAVYFVDVGSDSREGVVDGEYSYAVIDPFGSYLGDMWSADSSYRLSYGTFTDPSEIYSIVSSGIAKYSALSITRQNGYGLKWYQHPKIDTNPYYVPAGTTSLDLNSVRGQGYTSIHATGLTTMTRSNVSYTDSTVRYVDFSQCPCTSSSSQLLRNFKALITTDGLPSGFTFLPNYCFADCTSIERIDSLPSGVTTLNQGAFYGCTSLKLAALPESVRTIGQNCFTNCKNLDNTDGIGKVTSIGNSAFSMSTTGYDGNHSFSITEWPISVVPGYVFQNRNGISSIANLPTNVTSFANHSFNSVRGITDVVVPASVKTFGHYCFAYMYQVKTMDLLGTSGDFSIGQYAFYQMGTQNDSCIITFHCTKEELQAKANYPFTPYTGYGMVFRCTDGDINL